MLSTALHDRRVVGLGGDDEGREAVAVALGARTKAGEWNDGPV